MICVAFDLKGPTFRHKKYAAYKVTRKPMPDDLAGQLDDIKRLIRAYNIPIYELAGYEADDILATLAKKAESEGIESFVVTSDKDALQLVGPHIKVYNPQKDGMIYGEKEVREKFGVGPEKMTDLMGLMGDTSDNIPGIPGIGEKTAIELMREFGSLDEILENAHKIKSESRQKKIAQSRELALLSRDLATVRTDVPVEADFKDFRLKEPDKDALAEIFKEMEFQSLLKEYAPKREHKGLYRMVRKRGEFEDMLRELKGVKMFAFDFETTHYDPMKARPVGLSFAWKEDEAYYIPFNALQDMTEADVLNKLKNIFENSAIKKIGQNIKYDLLILKNKGIAVNGIEFDTMVASYLLNPSKARHNLNEISLEYLSRAISSIEDLVGKGKKAVTIDMVDVERVRDYCCEDSDVAFTLAKILRRKLGEKELAELFSTVEVPLIGVLARMEWWGVSVDKAYLNALSGEMEKDIKKLEEEIYGLAGETFNINSPKQLRVILFEKLKMPVIKRTKTGASTNEEVLKALASQGELPKRLLRYRELSKLKSTYADNLPELINSTTGRIHTSFNQAVTRTGRLSSSEPNLQNIPIKTTAGRKIRKAFVAEKKTHVLLSADYSQIELRILAHLSGDENLINALKEGRDVHTITASLIYGLENENVTPEMRAAAKTVNFGIIYGMSAYGLSKDLGIAVGEASKFIDAYFDRYPSIKGYLNAQIEGAREKGYVTTILGRRRYIPEIKSDNMTVRNFAERIAVNAPIQGSAADLIKLAMIYIDKFLDKFEARMILQVHDELVFEAPNKSLHELAGMVKNSMEGIMNLKVPVRVDLEYGKNWLEMEEMEL